MCSASGDEPILDLYAPTQLHDSKHSCLVAAGPLSAHSVFPALLMQNLLIKDSVARLRENLDVLWLKEKEHFGPNLDGKVLGYPVRFCAAETPTGTPAGVYLDYSMVIRFLTLLTPLTSLTSLVARSFSAAFFALPPSVTTPIFVVTEVLRALVER